MTIHDINDMLDAATKKTESWPKWAKDERVRVSGPAVVVDLKEGKE